ncbi:MAG: regulatory protein RecX [Gemmatimonadaceae bacterium]
MEGTGTEHVGVITAITPSTKREGQWDILVGGKLFATVGGESVQRLSLVTGLSVDEALAAAVREEAQAMRTLDRALDMLAFRARSVRELRRGLVRKGEPAETVDRAVERLVAAGLLDDAQFARQFARSKAVGRGLSRRRLRTELFRRGVAREVADEAIEEVLTDESIDEAAMIDSLARKKLRALTGLDAATRRRRLYAYLARRGYEPDQVRGATERLLGENTSSEIG